MFSQWRWKVNLDYFWLLIRVNWSLVYGEKGNGAGKPPLCLSLFAVPLQGHPLSHVTPAAPGTMPRGSWMLQPIFGAGRCQLGAETTTPALIIHCPCLVPAIPTCTASTVPHCPSWILLPLPGPQCPPLERLSLPWSLLSLPGAPSPPPGPPLPPSPLCP